MNYNQFYPFEQMELEYGYAGLEPNISEFTNFFHYNEHYLTALHKLNSFVRSHPFYQGVPLEMLSKSDNEDLHNLAGSVFNHEMHFSSLTDRDTKPSEYLLKRIESSFGSLQDMLEHLKNTSASLYGSGYVWLVESPIGKLKFILTHNHETPDFSQFKPVYALDLWEHGYYLDRQNHRADYVEAAIPLINWESIENNLRDYSFTAHR